MFDSELPSLPDLREVAPALPTDAGDNDDRRDPHEQDGQRQRPGRKPEVVSHGSERQRKKCEPDRPEDEVEPPERCSSARQALLRLGDRHVPTS